MKKQKVVKKESSYELLKRKLTLLKRLVLLAHSSVSSFESSNLTVTQWNEFIKEFPDEGEESKMNKFMVRAMADHLF